MWNIYNILYIFIRTFFIPSKKNNYCSNNSKLQIIQEFFSISVLIHSKDLILWLISSVFKLNTNLIQRLIAKKFNVEN